MNISVTDKLITQYCSDGVEYKELWELTYWDKRFNGVEKEKQKKVIKYPYLLANDINALVVDNGDVRILSTGIGEIKYTTEELAGNNLCKGEIVAIPWGGTPNIKYYKGKFVTGDNRIATSNDTNILNNKFLYYYLSNNIELISSFYRGAGIQHPSMKAVLSIKIPVPSLSVQEEIVKILDTYSELEAELETKLGAELDARKKQYEYHLNQLLSFDKNDKDIKFMPLCEACTVKRGIRLIKNDLDSNSQYAVYQNSLKPLGYYNQFNYEGDTTFVISAGAAGDIGYSSVPFWAADDCLCVRATEILNNKYIYYVLKTKQNLLYSKVRKGAVPRLSRKVVEQIIIPIPPLMEQERIVSILDEFNKLTNEISDSLQAEIIARKKQYEYYRNKLLTFKEAV